MYSEDRFKQLEYTISCLQDMKFFDQCQKTIILDGNANIVIPNFEVIRVPRINNQFSWANMWNAGVCSARFPVIWYLDSDRLLPEMYIETLLKSVIDDVFVFTSQHFMVTKDMSLELCKDFLQLKDWSGVFTSDKFLGCLQYEPKNELPFHGPGKNVMSGNTAFTKKTFFKLGGIDPWYKGHGAYADTDFHMLASQTCKFIDLSISEIHYHHSKKDNNHDLSKVQLDKLGLDNFIYYCRKWDLPMAYAENLAFRAGIHHSAKYVYNKVKEFSKEFVEIN
jgi:hypothetical protein